MCGRYSLSMRPSLVRTHLRTDLHMPVSSAPPDEGEDAPRRTHNFAPTYRGLVYRADVEVGGKHREDEGKEKDGGGKAGQGEEGVEEVGGEGEGGAEEVRQEGVNEGEKEGKEVQYKLQTMKWGLIPSWTKRAPNFSSSLKTINCRAESLMSTHGMWTSMKRSKRCVVLVEGFYEWLHKGREKVPHYVKRKDGGMMCFAGLWDCVRYPGEGGEEGEVVYSYTIVTKGSNKQLAFLHDRMPVMLEPGSEEMWTWLDPNRGWGEETARCMKGWEVEGEGGLEVYPVSKEVGKVGNDSPDFVVPVKESRGNITSFFGGKKEEEKKEDVKGELPKNEEVKEEIGKKEEIKGETGKKEEVKDEGVKKEEQDHKYNLRNETSTKKEEPNEGDIKMDSIEEDEADEKHIHKRETAKREEEADETPKKEEADSKTPKKEDPDSKATKPEPSTKGENKQGIKREHDSSPFLDQTEPAKKATRTSASPVKVKESPSPSKAAPGRGLRSSTRNDRGVVVQKTPKKGEKGTQKITGFFEKK